MKKRMFFHLVMLAVLLAFGLAFVGCDDRPSTVVTFVNNSTYEVGIVMEAGWSPSRISLAPGTGITSRTYEEVIGQPAAGADYSPANLVAVSYNHATYTYTFRNK